MLFRDTRTPSRGLEVVVSSGSGKPHSWRTDKKGREKSFSAREEIVTKSLSAHEGPAVGSLGPSRG